MSSSPRSSILPPYSTRFSIGRASIQPPAYDSLTANPHVNLVDSPPFPNEKQTSLAADEPGTLPPLGSRIEREQPASSRLPAQQPSSSRTAPTDDLSLLTSDGHAWAKLVLRDEWNGTPTFAAGSRICGSLDLDLPKKRPIQSIELTLRGKSTMNDVVIQDVGTRVERSDIFLTRSTTLWSPDMGNPHRLVNRRHSTTSTLNFDVFPSQGQSIQAGTSRPLTLFRSGKSREAQDPSDFIGICRLPFELKIPLTLVGPDGSVEEVPPSIDLKSAGRIDYLLTVTINYNGLFSKSDKIATSVNIVPRQPVGSTYIQRGPRPRLVTRTAVVKERLPGSREVDLQCKMVLAPPLIYARGTFIQLSLTITSLSNFVSEQETAATSQVLDLVSQQDAINLCLIRSSVIGTVHWAIKCVSMGLCWPSEESGSGANRGPSRLNSRTVNCEIELPPDLVPSFDFRSMSVSYKIILLPLRAKGLTASGIDAAEELLSVPVDIYADTETPTPNLPRSSAAPPGLKAPKLIKIYRKRDYTPVTKWFL